MSQTDPTPKTRAFLSHSSLDKFFIAPVARRLGRRRVAFDAWSFETGAKFMDAIRVSLRASDCFVLFASRSSLESLWVKFEVEEAEELMRLEALKSALVLIIDNRVRPADIPKWMQRALIETVTTPSAASRLIEYHLNKLRGLASNPLFIGRESLLKEFSETLIPAPEAAPPHLILLGGLNGIGRRTFLHRALQDFLSFRTGPTFVMQPTDGLDVLHLALLDELGELDTRADISKAIEQFQQADLQERSKALARLLAASASGNVAPVIVDEGAFLDSSGNYVPEAVALFDALRAYPETILGVLHTKRPAADQAQLRTIQAVYLRVPPLDLNATKLFLTQSLRRIGAKADSDQINELASYLDGYPPAINLAVAVAKEYGLATLVADKSGLIDFKIRTFAGVLEKLKLDASDWSILRILASEPVLPLQALAVAAHLDESTIAQHLRRLIDWNLVLPSGEDFAIAPPVKSAVFSLKGRLNDAEFADIARNLKARYWQDTDRIPTVQVIDATVHALLRSREPDLADFGSFVLPSVLYRTGKEYYDRGGQDAWERARSLIDQLLRLDDQHKQGLILLFKVQVRLRLWSEAESTLARIRERHMPEYQYLLGFLHWKKREYARAVTAFRTALHSGQRAMEIYHGLASCLFRLGNLNEAEKVIRAGLSNRRPNSLLLDLAAQLAIAGGDYEAAETYVDQLRRVRAMDDYNHRKATLLNARKRFAEARPFAEGALKSAGGRRRFEVEATLIDTLIEVHEFSRATELLNDLDNRERFGRDKRDVRLGLRCKLYLRQRNWVDAEAVWNEIEDKASPVHAALRIDILEQKISDLRTSPGQVAAAGDELNALKSKLLIKSDQVSLFAPSDDESSSDPEDGAETSHDESTA